MAKVNLHEGVWIRQAIEQQRTVRITFASSNPSHHIAKLVPDKKSLPRR